jgi:hypothetical protein
MLALMGPLTRTGRDYKNELVRRCYATLGDKTVPFEHCRLEVEADNDHTL